MAGVRATLHDELRTILTERIGGLTAAELAAAVERRGRYHRRDGKPVPVNQVQARISNHPELFARRDGRVHLRP